MKKLRYATVAFALLLLVKANAQTNYSPEDQTRVIHKHFLGHELQGIAQFEPMRYEAIQFYFKSSYSVEMIGCPTCAVDMHEFNTRDQFDITEFESLRLLDEEVEVLFKEKYKVVLMSKNNLNTHINSLDLNTLVSRKIHRPFPIWEAGNTQQDFAEYCRLVREWEKDFPSEFKAMYYSENFYKVLFSDFQELSEVEQNEILTNHSGYLLLSE